MKGLRNFIAYYQSLTTVLLISALVFASGCAKKEVEEIKIGAVLPLTGDIAEYGNRCKAGMDLAVEEINRVKGINGRKLTIIYEDSRGEPKTGLTVFEKLINIDKARFVIGAVSSSVTLSIEPSATKNEVILFSPASSSPKLSGISFYFFRNWPSDVLEATYLAEFVHQELQLFRIGILYVNNDYGIGLKDEFLRRFTELGGNVPFVEAYEQGATDFRTQLAKIKSAIPDGVYLAGYHREMAFATRQIRELGIKAQILGDADYGVDELLEIAGSAAEGAIYSMPEYETEAGSEAAKSFVESFKEQYSRDPSIFEANGYDAVRIIAEAIRVAGSNTMKVSEYIASLKDYHGASGDITFNIDHDVVKPVRMKIVKNGTFIDYYPSQ